MSKVITSLQNMRNIRKHKQTLSEEISTSRCILLYLQDRITKLEKVPGTD